MTTQEKPGFDKVTVSEKRLYGPRKLLLCGFDPEAQRKFPTVLEAAGLADVPKIWVGDDQAGVRVFELVEQPDGSGAGAASSLARAIIVCGITEAQLIGLMRLCKETGMRPPLWAVLTPVSEKWPVRRLLEELAREREAMGRK